MPPIDHERTVTSTGLSAARSLARRPRRKGWPQAARIRPGLIPVVILVLHGSLLAARPAWSSPPLSDPDQRSARSAADHPWRVILVADPPRSAPSATDAVALLAGKKLTRKKSVFVHESEARVREKLGELRNQVALFKTAAQELGEIQEALVMLPKLEQAIIDAGREINDLNARMGRFGAFNFRGATYRGRNFAEHEVFEGLRLQRDSLSHGREANALDQRELRSRQPGQNLDQATKRFERRRTAFQDAIEAMRKAVATTSQEYEVAAKEATVTQALAAIGQVKLGPSSDFTGYVQELNRCEKLIGAKVTGPRNIKKRR